MSFVTNLMFLNRATIARSNAEFAVMNNSEKMLRLANRGPSADVFALQSKDKELSLSTLQESLKAKIAAANEEALKKKLDKNIKNSFNTFI